jgi:hypothetical protein
MRRHLLLVASLVMIAGAGPLAAQGVRVTGITTARYIEIRPLKPDSVPVTETVGEGNLRENLEGRIVRCIPGETICRFRSPGEPISTVPLTQDIIASGWGYGQGIRVYAHVRTRAAVGEDTGLWPRADDPFDALAAYAELDRGRYRVRLGRQWKTSGLGYYNFDGASLLVRPLNGLAVDLYGGLGLVRGLDERYSTDAFSAVEEFPPEENAYLIGLQATYRPSARLAVSALYQREIRTDFAGLYSERVAADALLRLAHGITLTAAADADLATGDINTLQLRGRGPIGRGFGLELEANRHVPFFELWTIWGAFSPVGYDEALVGVTWSRTGSPLTLRLRGGWRDYDETHTGLGFAPIRSDGWRILADAAWLSPAGWTAFGRYGRQIDFGAALSEGDLGVRFDLSEHTFLGASAVAFQSIREFRVQEGWVVGGGVDGAVRLGPSLRVLGNLLLYRHVDDENGVEDEWSQLRATLRAEWTIGRDPGRARTRTGGQS